MWLAMASARESNAELGSHARVVLDALESRGPAFTQELQGASGLLASHFEMGLVELIGRGRITCDSFGGLRRLMTSPSRRRGVMKRAVLAPAGRWSAFRAGAVVQPGDEGVELVARRLLDRYGVMFRRLLARERLPIPWRDLVRIYRHMELRGDVRGGRFVQRFAGEQYALPDAVDRMRRVRRSDPAVHLRVAAADPLNLRGILTPDERVPAHTRRRVEIGPGRIPEEISAQ